MSPDQMQHVILASKINYDISYGMKYFFPGIILEHLMVKSTQNVTRNSSDVIFKLCYGLRRIDTLQIFQSLFLPEILLVLSKLTYSITCAFMWLVYWSDVLLFLCSVPCLAVVTWTTAAPKLFYQHQMCIYYTRVRASNFWFYKSKIIELHSSYITSLQNPGYNCEFQRCSAYFLSYIILSRSWNNFEILDNKKFRILRSHAACDWDLTNLWSNTT